MNLVIRLCLILSILWVNSTLANTPKNELRQSYKKWQSTYKSLSFDEQQALLKQLKNYPLYPYAAVQYFQHNIKKVSPQSVSDFVKKYDDFPLTPSLIQAYLTELTNRQDWNAIISFPRDNSLITKCRYQYAKLQKNNNNLVLDSVESIWLTGKELPSACDPLLDAWSEKGKRTSNIILLRIELALKNNNLKLARYLTNLLNDNNQTTKNDLLAILDNPRKLEAFSQSTKTSTFTKKIVLASYPRLVKTDKDLAAKLLPQLIKKQKLTPEEQNTLQRSLANSYFSDSATPEQSKWRDNYITKSHNTALVEKRIRMAIDANDYKDIAHWIAQLAPEDQLKEEWQYWQARVLLNKNKTNEAKKILETLTKKRGFYGMISAQTLNQPYIINNLSKAISNSEVNSLNTKYDQQPFAIRIKELRLLEMLAESKQEWRYMLNNHAQKDEYLDLAKYAYHKGWGDLSIQATISGKLWDNWNERLPIMYKKLYNDALKDKAIPLSYALAITRQESAFDTTVQSPVGASGLMQLMPATARETAKKISNITYYSPNQLFEPVTNVNLGTYFLNTVYLQNDNNRILSSAAYNAGPSRVKKWLDNSNGKLDAVAFIESIPFTETRNYVKSVLVYDYIYQHILGKPSPNILTTNELNRQY
jgi:soluble lytic murein transglycosylase